MRFWNRKPQVVHETVVDAPSEAEIRSAYDKGRRDERARHRRSPLLAVAVGSAALVGGAALVLAAFEGSFASGGAVMDAQVSTAAHKAVPALRDAASEAGDALQGATKPKSDTAS